MYNLNADQSPSVVQRTNNNDIDSNTVFQWYIYFSSILEAKINMFYVCVDLFPICHLPKHDAILFAGALKNLSDTWLKGSQESNAPNI